MTKYIVEHNIQYRDVPETNLHIFLRDYNSEWKDAFLPELRSINNEEVEISGISLVAISSPSSWIFIFLANMNAAIHNTKIHGTKIATLLQFDP